MELKLPPPLIFLLFAILLYFLPSPWEPIFILQCMAILSVFLGLYLDFSSLSAFWRKRTTISPFTPSKTSALTTDGIYKFTRNPMYLSLVCYLIAISLWLANPFGTILIWLFIKVITRFQILPEERVLAEKFGQAYLDYQQKVRRWL